MFKDVESERFIEAIDYLITNHKLKSYYKLAQDLNVKQQRFSDIKAGKQSIQIELLREVWLRYPYINIDYIILGHGTVVRENLIINENNNTLNKPLSECSSTDQNYNHLKKEFDELQAKNEELEAVKKAIQEEYNILLIKYYEQQHQINKLKDEMSKIR